MGQWRLILLGLWLPIAAKAQIRPSIDSSALFIQTGHKEYLTHCWQRVYGDPFLWVQFSQQEWQGTPHSAAIPFAYAPENVNIPLHWATWPNESRLQANGSWVYANSSENQAPVSTTWTGTTLSAKDSRATLSLRLSEHPVREHLHLWISQPKSSFNVALVSGLDTQWMSPSTQADEPLLWLEFPRAVSLHNAQLIFQTSDNSQNHFTVHGLIASGETNNDGYWIYAGLPNLSMPILENQLKQGLPNQTRLVVLELGAQELRQYSGVPTSINSWRSQAQHIITEIQRQIPEADIVLVSPMAQLRGGQPNPLAQNWSYVLRELAEDMDCGFFDWFRISGGLWAMQDWIDAGWAEYDGQRLTKAGQQILSQCWWLAWNGSLMATGPEIWVSDGPTYQAMARPISSTEVETESAVAPPATSVEPFLPSFHTVSPGETLYSISKRYNCSVSQLQSLNGLGQSTQIRIGQKLRVPRP